MFKVFNQLLTLNFKAFYRQPETIFWAIVFPLALFWVLGLAFDSSDHQKTTIGIVGGKPLSLAGLPEKFRKDAYVSTESGKKITLAFQTYNTAPAAIKDLKQGKIALFLQPTESGYNYYFDPQNKEAQFDYLLLEKIQQPVNERVTVVPLKAKGTRYIEFFLPGLMAFNMLNSCLWGVGWGLIEIRMKKYLKRLMATPIPRWLFIFALVITRLVTSAAEVCLLLLFAHFYFHISIQGSYLAFVYLFILGNFAFSGLAILISSRTANSVTGNGLISALTMPMMLTSGVFFSYHNFPPAVVACVKYLPLTILVDNMRAVFIESAGFTAIFYPSLILVGFAVVSFVVGLRIFKWY